MLIRSVHTVVRRYCCKETCCLGKFHLISKKAYTILRLFMPLRT
jgi:hypothetical protein